MLSFVLRWRLRVSSLGLVRWTRPAGLHQHAANFPFQRIGQHATWQAECASTYATRDVNGKPVPKKRPSSDFEQRYVIISRWYRWPNHDYTTVLAIGEYFVLSPHVNAPTADRNSIRLSYPYECVAFWDSKSGRRLQIDMLDLKPERFRKRSSVF
jgi:hypothetical protein